MTKKLSPNEIYKDRKVFLIGSTGFLGKVTLSMLLHRFPSVGRVYVTVRARAQEESETRFWNNVITAPPFDPLRERYGSALDGFIRDKVAIVGGDIADHNLGFDDEEAQRIADDIDVVINSAGNVTFNPTLVSALRTNVVGTQNVIAFTKRMKRPCLIHISTCFVAGNRSGAVWENDEVLGYFPRKDEVKGVDFSVEQEILDCAKMSERAREEAKDAMRVAHFREQARKRLNEEMRDEDDPVMLAVAAQACVEQPRLVHQVATGDSNPNNMERIISLVGLFRRSQDLEKKAGLRLFNEISARIEPFRVSPERFESASLQMMNKSAKRFSSLLDKARPRWGGGRYEGVINRMKQTVDRVEEQTREATEAFEMFLPFTSENAYVFRSDNVRALFESIREEERHLLTWNPETFDWYDYWLNIHMPGLKKWVLPTLEEDMRTQPKRIYTYPDLLELFETTTKRHSTRVAMRIERDGRKEQYTYADLRELATRAAAFFASNGIKSGDRVMLFSHNAPEWGMTYFGVLKTGGTCIPVDPESTTEEIVNFARAGEASGIVISTKLKEEHADLRERLKTAGLAAIGLWTFDEVFEMSADKTEQEPIGLLPQRVTAQTVASLIFTSGTTGRPKGVMLSHRNLTSMVSMLSSVFDMDTSDGVLSVLPLHHTFEFSTGFLTPLSRGAQITYLPELTSDHLAKAIKNGHVTGMVGVPALWELLHRRIKNRLHERGKWIGEMADVMMKFNAWLRDKTPLNLGQAFFYPIHEGLGGRIRYFISGGSALNDKVQRDFQGLGFTILEGYGLTEASPVLTVTRPENRMLAGTVGKSLPGVEVRIADPDASGVGEVIARGPNVMLGYFGNEEATKEALVDRWLYTGDLGRIDDEGNLYLVGRSKDIIVDTNGKNVYPDEVEEVYQDSPYIKEMSVIGLPDGIGEKVACLVVPNEEHDIALTRADLRQKS